MMRPLRTAVILAVAAFLAGAVLPGAVLAQPASAEVRTWTGLALVVSEPALVLQYNVIIQKDALGTAPTGEAVSPGADLELRGNLRALSSFLERGVESRWGLRSAENIGIQRDGIEMRIPVDNIHTLVFTRQLVTHNVLPPYHAPKHFRRAATAVLRDGSSIEGDYISLGTAVLTGTTPQGRVAIPWEEIELIRFDTR